MGDLLGLWFGLCCVGLCLMVSGRLFRGDLGRYCCGRVDLVVWGEFGFFGVGLGVADLVCFFRCVLWLL